MQKVSVFGVILIFISIIWTEYEVYLRIQFKCGKVALFTQCQDYSPETWTTTSQRDTYFDQIESTDDVIIAICDHSDFEKIL